MNNILFSAWRWLVCGCILVCGISFAFADDAVPALPFLHPLFTDNMVLQRDVADPVWGWTTPGAKVTVSLQDKRADAVADAGGKWLARIGPFSAGGPYTLTVTGPQQQTVTLKNILIGDVWICSGQSNMEMGIGNVLNAKEEIDGAAFPNIRLCVVPKRIAFRPQGLLTTGWAVCTPETVSANGWGGFSAAGYFFGRQLYKDLNVPMGLIESSWGGTVAEAWTSADALQAMPDFASALTELPKAGAEAENSPVDYPTAMANWYTKNDPGTTATPGWGDKDFHDASWKTLTAPGAWDDASLGAYDGVVWFRKEIDVAEAGDGLDLTLRLGPIGGRDTVWFNGSLVGGGEELPGEHTYTVPGKLVKVGRNVIAVRILKVHGKGGFLGKAAQMQVEFPVPDQEAIALAGPWRYQPAVSLAKAPPVPVKPDNNPNRVTVLYNGMIAPLLPFAIKGAIWYQGESNCGRAVQYQTLLPTMIKDWRARFGVGEFPFFIVQLANFMAVHSEPTDSGWAELREAQLLTSQQLPNTGLAVAIDIGDAGDIHPKNKQEVGRRLALSAEGIAYGKKIEYAGPTYASMKIDGAKIRLTFEHVGGGLVAKGEKLQGFAIAGADKVWVWADATIDGAAVVVTSPQVTAPTAVRYAWADNPVCNLYNDAGLPATPFRTDR